MRVIVQRVSNGYVVEYLDGSKETEEVHPLLDDAIEGARIFLAAD